MYLLHWFSLLVTIVAKINPNPQFCKIPLSQPFYACLGGSLELKWRYLNLNLWVQNITNASYDVFYFVSMSRHFLQPAKPVRFGVRLTFEY